MLSKSCEYVLKAMLYLAKCSTENRKLSAKEIAEETNVSANYMAKVLQNLSKAKLVKSQKGPNGGFYLTEKDLETSLADIIKSVDGDRLFVKCVLGLKNCSDKQPCPLHSQYQPLKRDLIKLFGNCTLGDFQLKTDMQEYFLKLN